MIPVPVFPAVLVSTPLSAAIPTPVPAAAVPPVPVPAPVHVPAPVPAPVHVPVPVPAQRTRSPPEMCPETTSDNEGRTWPQLARRFYVLTNIIDILYITTVTVAQEVHEYLRCMLLSRSKNDRQQASARRTSAYVLYNCHISCKSNSFLGWKLTPQKYIYL